jgi:hypothetical protein
MRLLRIRHLLTMTAVCCSILALPSAPALAQAENDETTAEGQAAAEEPAGSSPERWKTSGSDRLFLGFSREATVADDQWWEGRGELAGATDIDAILGRFVFAIQPLYQLEVGGDVGFGSTSSRGDLPDGSGATDLDLWIKYYLGAPGENTEFAIGGTVTVPTGDDTAGLGQDSWAVGLFGSFRHSLRSVLIGGYLGAQYNQDGKFLGIDLDGKISFLAGGSVIWPVADKVTVVGELVYESEQFDSIEGLEVPGSDGRALGGLNWRVSNRGLVRAALGFGFTDAAPDYQILAGYAVTF